MHCRLCSIINIISQVWLHYNCRNIDFEAFSTINVIFSTNVYYMLYAVRFLYLMYYLNVVHWNNVMRNSDLKNYRGFWQMWVKLVVIYSIYSITIINLKKNTAEELLSQK